MIDSFSDRFTPGVVEISLISSIVYPYKRDVYAATKFPQQKDVII